MKSLFILLVCLALLNACTPLVREVPYTARTFEPTTEVDILRTEPLDREFIRITRFEVDFTADPESALEVILDRAKQAGADALIVHGIETPGFVEVPLAGSHVQQTSTARVPLRRFRATAIKYESF